VAAGEVVGRDDRVSIGHHHYATLVLDLHEQAALFIQLRKALLDLPITKNGLVTNLDAMRKNVIDHFQGNAALSLSSFAVMSGVHDWRSFVFVERTLSKETECVK